MHERFAVMGAPVAHSLSPVIHHAFAEQCGIRLVYEKRLVSSETLASQISSFFESGGRGLNVTHPCKLRAFALSAIATPRCKTAHAANTLWMDQAKLYADNTDGIGLVRDLKRYTALAGKRILILGAGGAAQGIIPALEAEHPKQIMVANRTREKAQALQHYFKTIRGCGFSELDASYEVIIKATPVDVPVEDFSLPAVVLENRPFCYDLGYVTDGQSPWVAYAQKQGLLAQDGLGMLVEQAAEAFYVWHGVRPDSLSVLEILQKKRLDGEL